MRANRSDFCTDNDARPFAVAEVLHTGLMATPAYLTHKFATKIPLLDMFRFGHREERNRGRARQQLKKSVATGIDQERKHSPVTIAFPRRSDLVVERAICRDLQSALESSDEQAQKNRRLLYPSEVKEQPHSWYYQ
jgi:hypothetical protein